MQIKICGLKRKEDVNYVNHAKPDYVGFVFAGTKRNIDFDTAKELKKELNPDISSVGVFVNEDINFILQLVAEGILDVIQLHGDEDAEYICCLKNALEMLSAGESMEEVTNIPIIKAVRVRDTQQVLDAEKLDVDYLLLDAFIENEYGGGGKTFNHELIPGLTKPYFLAGGLNSQNIIGILDTLKKKGNMPCCVDVSSSVETQGKKDENKIHSMVSLVQSYC